jgi:endonuclease YncB( thermonuclease family)
VIRALAFALVLIPLDAAADPLGTHTLRCRALDGDTLQCGAERVRLRDIYTAEMNEAGGAQARRNLRSRVDGRDIQLKRYGQDRYGRTLADIYVDGRKLEQADIGPRAGNGVKTGYASKPK